MKKIIFILFAVIMFILAAFIGYSLGKGQERLRNYDQYIYPFSQYSSHLLELVERNETSKLTNDIILFDSKYNPDHSPEKLQDVIFKILKLGKYYENTNSNI